MYSSHSHLHRALPTSAEVMEQVGYHRIYIHSCLREIWRWWSADCSGGGLGALGVQPVNMAKSSFDGILAETTIPFHYLSTTSPISIILSGSSGDVTPEPRLEF